MDGLFFDPEKPKRLNYGVLIRASNSDTTTNCAMIGVIGVTSRFSLDTVEIGYIFNQSFWGQGYASEALVAYIEAYWGYSKGINFIIAKVDPFNMGSIRVLEKCGFRVVERFVGDIILPGLGRRDTTLMKLDRP
ncbi:acyl-CoA N-acyltransferase [Morchella conica CCBAS932]|uniref:Acyl-CoA N-acyltransferase n=2 Tax=Morchella sect. Distantes TaxID=1051054 RepID=A0A3N4KX91_9PEZI|nr:acyl-CoA N-acyltransferase [Morchella conica CCBAS932]